jgi:cytochrome c biogenesis protein ResB
LWRALWRHFKSLRFGLILLAIIAGVCVYGAVRFSANPALGKSQVPIARTTVFQSWWFASLLALFAFQLLVSTWHVTVMSLTLWRRKEFRDDAKFFASTPAPTATLRLGDGGMEKLRSITRKRFSFSHTKTHSLFAHRGLMSRVGPTVVHAGMLIVLGAGMLRAVLLHQGVVVPEGRFLIAEGERSSTIVEPVDPAQIVGGSNVKTRDIPGGVSLRLLDFSAERHPNVPDAAFFSSLLEIYDPRTQGVRVVQVDMNHALKLNGFTFHQSQYSELKDEGEKRQEYDVRVRETGERVAILDASPGAPVRLGKTGKFIVFEGAGAGSSWHIFHPTRSLDTLDQGIVGAPPMDGSVTLTVAQFFPAFGIGEDGKPANLGNKPSNPVAEIVVAENGVETARGWVEIAGAKSVDSAWQNSLPFTIRFQDMQVRPGAAEVAWQQPGQVLFMLEVRTRATDIVLWRDGVTLRESTAPIPMRKTWSERLASVPGGSTHVVFFNREIPRHLSVLSVVREPTIPATTFGVAVILFGAIMTFVSRYSALYAFEDTTDGVCHLALVPRWSHGRAAAENDLAGLLVELRTAGIEVVKGPFKT